MKKSMVSLLAATMMAGAAHATMIDFSQFAVGPAVTETAGSSFDVGDYRFTYWYGQNAVFFTTNSGKTALGDDQSESLGAAFTLTRIDGNAFDVNAFTFGLSGLGSDDGADTRIGSAPYSGGDLTYVGTDGQNFTTPSNAAYKNVTKFGFDTYTSDDAVGLRSLDVSLAGAGAMPEPATWGLMLFGFGLLGASARRRTRTTITYA